jgi:murein L,D-transpeptidase YafK
MKTALFISALIVGGTFLTKDFSSKTSANTLYSFKSTKAKKTSSAPIAPVRIVVDKSNYELYVYDAQGWYATYPVVFGNKSLADKKMEGDRNTPEGTFRVVSKRVHEKWSRFMGLDYPTKEDKISGTSKKR